MSSEVFEKLKQLPPDKQQEAEDFITFLVEKYKNSGTDNVSLAEERKKNAGRMKGQIWMADDFNNTPLDFKEYT